MREPNWTGWYMPRIGDLAPDFSAPTTQGIKSLDDYKGKWLILFSHTADFTPVCATEYIRLAEIAPKLRRRGVELLGLSVDSVPSHIAWLRSIEEKADIRIPFPVVSDPNQIVATDYGMVHPGHSDEVTVRSVFFIDPHQYIRAILYYPHSVGRSVDELVRMVEALQTADKKSVSMPADWQPGDKVVVPAPLTCNAAESRDSKDYEYTDWYLCMKAL